MRISNIWRSLKFDAYGHGSVECSQRLEKEGVDWFGVALPAEGVELRNNGIKKRILCLGSFWTGQENLLLDNSLTPVIYQIEQAENFNLAAKDKDIQVDIHVKIDTGMGRIGVRFDQVEEFAGKLKKFRNLNVEGLMTHFASADDLSENAFTNLQIKRFEDSLGIFNKFGFNPKYKDLANSPASVAHPNSHGNLIRLGGVLYGLGDDILPQSIKLPELKSILQLFTKIAHIKRVPKGETLGYSRTFKTKKDSIIATIPIGYQDGYTRTLSNKSQVIINGKFVPVVGRISMDWTLLDITDFENVKIGDTVTLIGKDRDSVIKSSDLARISNTISYEITCGINSRVEKVYVESK